MELCQDWAGGRTHEASTGSTGSSATPSLRLVFASEAERTSTRRLTRLSTTLASLPSVHRRKPWRHGSDVNLCLSQGSALCSCLHSALSVSDLKPGYTVTLKLDRHMCLEIGLNVLRQHQCAVERGLSERSSAAPQRPDHSSLRQYARFISTYILTTELNESCSSSTYPRQAHS